jgi:ParB family transcriptional regulator, chromosome partitioning protein
MDERRLAVLFRLYGIGKTHGTTDAPTKLLMSFLRKADEETLGRILVEVAVLQAAHSSNESAQNLHEAAKLYKVDVAAIKAKVGQEFIAKEKARAAKKSSIKAKVGQEFIAKEKARAAKKSSPKPPAKTPAKTVKKSAA